MGLENLGVCGMDRSEVLRRARTGHGSMDEREQQMLGVSFGFGAVAMTLLCVVLAAVRILQGEHAYDYAAILFAYLAGAQAHQYWKTRRRSALIAAVAYTFVLAANLIFFLG